MITYALLGLATSALTAAIIPPWMSRWFLVLVGILWPVHILGLLVDAAETSWRNQIDSHSILGKHLIKRGIWVGWERY